MSRTPESDICIVRGMGVADNVSTSMYSRRFFICSLCPTPNRCSSSMITRPKSCGLTSRDSRRWVPTRISTEPEAKPSSASRCWDGERNRDSTCTFTPNGSQRSRKFV